MFRSLAFLAFSLIPVGIASGQINLDQERFEELMSSVVPAEDSKLIDWIPDLLEAQKLALKQKKPMFIWSMDGNPLGCT
jgi:hypothetical protein